MTASLYLIVLKLFLLPSPSLISRFTTVGRVVTAVLTAMSIFRAWPPPLVRAWTMVNKEKTKKRKGSRAAKADLWVKLHIPVWFHSTFFAKSLKPLNCKVSLVSNSLVQFLPKRTFQEICKGIHLQKNQEQLMAKSEHKRSNTSKSFFK